MTDGKTCAADLSVLPPGRPSCSLFRLFLMATIPPAIIVALDELAVLHGNRNRWDPTSYAILYGLYVVQVAALTCFIGRFLATWLLRWVILLWVLALIDLRLFTLASSQYSHSTSCLTYAFLSGQLSLLVFIATLGPGRWPWRLPSVLVVTVVVLFFLFGERPWHEIWSSVLILQTLVTFLLFVMLLLAGYRIRYRQPDHQRRSADLVSPGFRFSIGHILFWMLAAVPVLTIGQHLSPNVFTELDLITWLRLAFVAACLSVVPFLVVITVFSRRHLPWVIPLCLLLVAGLGGMLAVFVNSRWVPALTARTRWQDWLLADLSGIGFGWIPWTLLSAAFLAGLLLLFPVAGYRLEHRRQPRSPFVEEKP